MQCDRLNHCFAKFYFVLEDAAGGEVAKIQERKLHVRDTMAIERDSKKIAEVHKRLVGFRDRLKVDLDGGDEYTVKGKLGDHEYTIKGEHGKVAEITTFGPELVSVFGLPATVPG